MTLSPEPGWMVATDVTRPQDPCAIFAWRVVVSNASYDPGELVVVHPQMPYAYTPIDDERSGRWVHEDWVIATVELPEVR
jgi:hypothetical protein